MKNAFQNVTRIAISIGVSLVVLALLLQLTTARAGTREGPKLLEVLRSTALVMVAAYFALALLQGLFRAVRYRLLIRASGENCTPPLRHVYLVTLTRNMLVDLLPARLGELSYVAMMNRGCRVSGKACLSSLGISFLFDFVALLFVIAGVLAVQALTSSLQLWLVSVLAVLTIVVAAMAAVVFAGFEASLKLFRVFVSRIRWRGVRRQTDRALEFLETTAAAIASTRRAGILGKVLLLSLCVRATKYVGLYGLFLGVVRPSFPDLAGASFGGVLCALLGAEGGASLPIPAFMSFGVYEAGGMLALTLLGFPAAISTVAMLAMHIWSQGVDYLLGGVGFVVFLFATAKSTTDAPASDSRVGVWQAVGPVVSAVMLLAGAGFMAMQYRKAGKIGAVTAPDAGTAVELSAAEGAALQQGATEFRGFIVWSSNRSGSHDILMMRLPGLEITRLTTHPHVDTFPRISPDGTRIVFARSQTPWVSQRNSLPWDVIMLDLQTGEETLVAKDGNVPTWSEDGTRVYFQRDGSQFVEHELSSGAERIPFRAGAGGIPDGVVLQTPSFRTATQAMAVTLRGAKRGTGVAFMDGRLQVVGGGCQLVWTPQEGMLCYVDHGGRQQNAIYGYDLGTQARTLWIDTDGEFSHEYFPSVSRDGRCIVFGASRGGRHDHEHDTSDYEIFLWKTGAPPGGAVRMTHHTGNDCWPDIYVSPSQR